MTSSVFLRWFKPGAYSLVNRIFVVLFGFINIFFLVRLLSQAEIGVWVLFTSVTSILETLRNGFIRNPFISHFVVAEEERKNSFVSGSLFLHILLVVVVIVLLMAGSEWLARFWRSPDLEALLYIYVVNSLIFIPYLHFEYLLQSRIQFKGIFISNAIRLGLLSLYIVVSFLVGLKVSLFELAIVQGLATAIAVGISFLFARPYLSFRWEVSRKVLTELFHFGKFTIGTTISSMLIKNTDSWMIGRFVSSIGVALYNPAIRISNLVEVPTLAVANLVFPQVGSTMKNFGIKGVQSIYDKSVSLILAIMLPVCLPLYLFSDQVIVLIFGPDYMAASPILRVTLFYSLIIPFNRQFGTVMDALKMPNINFYLLVLLALLNLIFNYIFLNEFGLIGSAYATLLSYCLIFLINQIILYQKFRINTFLVLMEIFNWYLLGWNMLAKKGKGS